jgi:hypothetical protein
MSMSIKTVATKDGDWIAVLINGQVDYEGHSIPDRYWIELLKSFGFNAEVLPDISTEDMIGHKFYPED